MEQFSKLRNSEKNLIYILVLLLILLIYTKFFRNPYINSEAKEEYHSETTFVYDDINNNTIESADKINNKDLENKEVNSQIFQYESNPNYNRSKELTNSFGKKVNLLALAEENNLNVVKYDVKPVQKNIIDNIDYYYIDSLIGVKGDKNNIDSFLYAITSVKDLFVNKLEMKSDAEDTIFNLNLREFSLEPVTLQVSENNQSAATNNQPIYNFPEYRPRIDPNSYINTNSKPIIQENTNSNNSSNTNEDTTINNEDVKKEENVELDNKNNSNEESTQNVENAVSAENTQNPDFSRIDAINSVNKRGGRHLVNTKYVSNNYEFLKDKSNIKNFSDPNYASEFEFVFLGNLSLVGAPLYIGNGEKNISASIYGGTNATIYLKDSNGNEAFISSAKSGSGYETVRFEIPNDLSYPVRITSISVSGGGGSNAKAKNIVAY